MKNGAEGGSGRFNMSFRRGEINHSLGNFVA